MLGPGLRVRRNKIFPRVISDIGAFFFVTVMMPLTFVYELHVVLPAIYLPDSKITYYVHGTIGTFLLFSLIGNFCGKNEIV